MTNENFSTKVRSAETEHRSKIEATYKRYADAVALLPTVVSEYDQTRIRVAEIRQSWSSLCDDYGVEDYTLAKAAEVRAQQRVRGAHQEYRTAERARRGLRTNLAEVAAQVMRRALPGVTVISTFAPVSGTPKTSELPLALVQQTDFPDTDDVGAEKGKVTVAYYFSQIHSGLPTTEAVEWAAREVGADVRCLHRGGGSGGMESMTLEVIDRPELPFHEDVTESHHGRLAALMSATVAENLTPESDSVRGHVETSLCQSARVTTVPGETRGTEVVDAEGRRTITIESSVLLETTGAYLGGAEGVAAAATRAAESLVGLYVADLGKVESVEIVDDSTSGLAMTFEQIATRVRATELTAGMSRSRQTSDAAVRGMNAHQAIVRATVVSSSTPHVESDDELRHLVMEVDDLAKTLDQRARWETDKYALLNLESNMAQQAVWAEGDARLWSSR